MGLVVGVLAVDQHLADVAAQAVADGPDDDVVLLIEQSRAVDVVGGLADGLVELQQVLEVPGELVGVAVDAGGADDHAHAVRDFEV